MKTIRERAAKAVYDADLTLNDDTSVKQIIDLLEAFGEDVARTYYHEGIADSVLGKPKKELFCDKIKNKENLPS